MTRSLTGKVALVTGAGKGIGAGIAKAMAAAGVSVVVNFASDRPGAERVVADIKAAGGNAFAIQANVSVVAEVQRLLAETVTTFGPLDILVNNASVFAFASLEQTTDEQLHKMLDTNLWGTIVTCREALKHFGNDAAASSTSDRCRANASPLAQLRTPRARPGSPE
jgi:3-oxoacyl-[acyl-carrier protein] reductase